MTLLRLLCLVLGLMLAAAPMASAQTAPVTVTEDRETYTLSNGLITAVVSKRTSDLISLQYKGFETLAHDTGGHSAAYWSHDVSGGQEIVSRITIDPAANGGERAEVSVKGISGGIKMGHGPGTARDGDFPADIEIRYSLGRGESGVYTWCIFDHKPEYGTATMAEARIAAKLTAPFTYIHVDAERHGLYPLFDKTGDKYAYVALQARERAFGWTSPERKLGWFLLNPSAEYLSGGPTKAEFLAHGEHPTVLNYWKSSHYGGANVTVREGERWSKVIGPFLFYINEGETPVAMWDDARRQLEAEEAKWPYDWAKSPHYVNSAGRGQVTGRLRLDDPITKGFPGKLTIGVTRTPYTVVPADGKPLNLTWHSDAKNYQFWSVQVSPDGRFVIPDVIAGDYNLYAYADGVLGEFSRSGVSVTAGQTVDLGEVVWQPVRKGAPLWEIGVPDRSGAEFAGGRRYFEIGTQLIYAERFPDDVTFRIGQSKEDTDWFFAQMPHVNGPAEIAPIRGVLGQGRATPYRIDFNLAAAPTGTATLRLAINATSGPGVEVTLNGQALGTIPLGPSDGALLRHQMYGRWHEKDLSFDASLLQAGDNRLTLTMPAGALNNGVVYDYLRLEVSETR